MNENESAFDTIHRHLGYINPTVLQRRQPRQSDADDYLSGKGVTRLASEIRQRPVVKIMNFADYDHDGQASEFFI
ncbi:MAG: hypothetical protein DMG16_02240 [Acidobacteria bacterium]|nr:MAG: hypothetical protein DMG16_02240 [Acidobacteriota bacterium]